MEKIVFESSNILISKINNSYFVDEISNGEILSSSIAMNKDEINDYLINNGYNKINVNSIE